MSALAIFNSNLFNFLFYLISDARHITPRETLGLIKVDEKMAKDSTIHDLGVQLDNDYNNHATIVTYNKKNGITKYAQFNPRLSKPIIDEIDKVLAKHYGFTEEELDFIINYDIKYRMGDELGEESNSEPQPKVSQPEKPHPAKQRQKPVEQEPKPKDNMLTMKVGKETIERIKSGEKTTFKRYLDDEVFAKEVLVTENGKVKLSKDHCPYTAKNITSIKLVCDGESLVKAVTKISFRTGTNQQGKTAWKIIFHF